MKNKYNDYKPYINTTKTMDVLIKIFVVCILILSITSIIEASKIYVSLSPMSNSTELFQNEKKYDDIKLFLLNLMFYNQLK